MKGLLVRGRAVRAGAAALTLLLAVGCSSAGGKGAAAPAVARTDAGAGGTGITGIKVKVIQPEVGSITRQTEFSGTIEASSTVNVYPEVDGKVAAIHVGVGETVRQGQLLFELDDSDLQEAVDTAYLTYQSQLSQAQSSILNAEDSYNNSSNSYLTAKENLNDFEDEGEAELDRLRAAMDEAKEAMEAAAGTEEYAALAEAYNAAKSEYASYSSYYSARIETLETERDNARESMNSKRESYELVSGSSDGSLLGSANVTLQLAEKTYQNALSDLENTKVYAPVSGIVSARNVEESERAAASSPAYVISGTGSPVVSFNASEGAAKSLEVGGTVSVRYDGDDYAATVIEVSTSAGAGGLYNIKAQMAGDLGTTRTGGVVKVTATTAKAQDALILPLKYVEYDVDQAYVYLYRDGAAVRTDLVTGIYNEESVVIEEGLAAGDYVITTWHPDLADGAAVYCLELGDDGSSPGEEAAAPADGAQPGDQPGQGRPGDAGAAPGGAAPSEAQSAPAEEDDTAPGEAASAAPGGQAG